MGKLYSVLAAMCCCVMVKAGPTDRKLPVEPGWKKEYRATAEKKFDLVHTKVAVRFDYTNRRMPGQVWVTVKPHFYTQDTLVLDAKGMFINKVSLVNGTSLKPLAYDYSDSMHLMINLGRTYKKDEKLTIFVDYVSRPDEQTFAGSKAITDAKGLYFINPDGKDTSKPIQIWTQGETEATSVWCPTLDRPNQKTTQETIMTVPAKYVTLSNGLLVHQKKHTNGTRTDTWKMDQPHSPYLFFMGVGGFAVINDKYKNIPVQYYVEPKYATVARRIFGLTPEMMGFYSKLLGVEYPWAKYAQIVGRDYVSGAMENTTATLHGSGAYQKARQLVDENRWETTVAHELFHQWFGDYVTAESWSNLTVNESMADYSEYLWLEHKYGKDRADNEWYTGASRYLASPANAEKHLVRFYYADKEDMFDLVSYQKGGRVLHMLRNYIGDSAFFKGLNLYLTTNKFKNGEAHQLRMAFEEVSGQDLNWFFNQWYFGNGHPVVDIRYAYDDAAGKVTVVLEQKQKEHVFKMPLFIDLYTGGKKERHEVWMENQLDSFTFNYSKRPELVNVDGDKTMLWKKTDNKSAGEFIAQYTEAGNYTDRREALDYLTEHFDSSAASHALLALAMNDQYDGLRVRALKFFGKQYALLTPNELQTVERIAQNDRSKLVRAAAIDVLGKNGKKELVPFFAKAVTDSSYTVAGAALEALLGTDEQQALAVAPQLKQDAEGRLKTSLKIVDYLQKDVALADTIIIEYKKMNVMDRAMNLKGITYFASKVQDVDKFRKLAGSIIENYTRANSDFGGFKSNAYENIMWLLSHKEAELAKNPANENLKKQVDYMKEKLKG